MCSVVKKIRNSGKTSLLTSHHGYTLYLVLLILSISVVLFTITVREIRSVRIFAKKEVQKSQAKLLAESGIIRTEYFLNGGDGHDVNWETAGFEEKVGDYGAIHLSVERFGFFSRVVSTGTRQATSCTVNRLFGRTVPKLLEPSLTLTGHVGGLILQKGSSVEGKIVLHHGYVYARKKGQPLREYTRRLTLRESPLLPFDTLLIPELFEKLKAERAAFLKNSKAKGSIMIDHTNDTLLKQGTLVVNGDCSIKTDRCKDAVIVVEGTCTVEHGADIRNTACYAGTIIIEEGNSSASLFYSEKTIQISGGSHGSQFCAGDSIIVKKDAGFGSMAILAGLRQEYTVDSLTKSGGGIYVDDYCIVKGTVICAAATGINRNAMSSSIVFGSETEITATVVTDGDCRFYKSNLKGRLWARSIVAKDAEGTYTNYLIESSIEENPDEIPFPLLGEPPMEIVAAGNTMQPLYDKNKKQE